MVKVEEDRAGDGRRGVWARSGDGRAEDEEDPAYDYIEVGKIVFFFFLKTRID